MFARILQICTCIHIETHIQTNRSHIYLQVTRSCSHLATGSQNACLWCLIRTSPVYHTYFLFLSGHELPQIVVRLDATWLPGVSRELRNVARSCSSILAYRADKDQCESLKPVHDHELDSELQNLKWSEWPQLQILLGLMSACWVYKLSWLLSSRVC
jgi:hypothetical protein